MRHIWDDSSYTAGIITARRQQIRQQTHSKNAQIEENRAYALAILRNYTPPQLEALHVRVDVLGDSIELLHTRSAAAPFYLSFSAKTFKNDLDHALRKRGLRPSESQDSTPSRNGSSSKVVSEDPPRKEEVRGSSHLMDATTKTGSLTNIAMLSQRFLEGIRIIDLVSCGVSIPVTYPMRS